MLLAVVNNVETTDFYRSWDKVAPVLLGIVMVLFAAMFIYAAIRYAKR